MSRKPLTQAEIDGMPTAEIRRRIHENEMQIARLDERATVRLETAVADPEWAEIARLTAWMEAEPMRKKQPEPKVWPSGFDAEAYTKGFVAKQFARAGHRPVEDAAVSATAKEYLKRLG